MQARDLRLEDARRNPAPGIGSTLVAVLLVGALLACRREDPVAQGTAIATPRASLATPESTLAPSEPVTTRAPDASTPRSPSDASIGDSGDSTREPTLWQLGELSDVGPAGPATAHETGVLMVTRKNELLLAKRQSDKFSPIVDAQADFRVYARAPALLRGFAYWVNGRELLRQRIGGSGPADVLARDARHSTRVATPPDMGQGPAPPHATDGRAAAAYIAESRTDSKELYSMLWVEGEGTQHLTPEGSGAHSVALAWNGLDLLAVSLDAHMGMTPVHLRRIRMAKLGPKLDESTVAWVGAGATPLTEIFTLNTAPDQAWAMLGMQKDITHFGLAYFPLIAGAAQGANASFMDYKNGIDPAPVASAIVCGRPTVAFARPASAQLRAPQELRLGPFTGELGVPESEPIAHSRAFSDVSLAPIPGGSVVAYVADHRTWARVVHCRKALAP